MEKKVWQEYLTRPLVNDSWAKEGTDARDTVGWK
jgi:hypothetical protein